MNDVVYDLAEPIQAYRAWRVLPWTDRDSNKRLGALSFSTIWEREMTALPCTKSDPEHGHLERRVAKCDGPPCAGKLNPRNHGTMAYGCGIYAVKDLSTALFEMGFHADVVIGKVLLGGKVWPHETGYRAEKAQIVGLYSSDAFTKFQKYLEFRPGLVASHPHLRSISQAYDVPVVGELPDEEEQALIPALEEYWIDTRLGLPV